MRVIRRGLAAPMVFCLLAAVPAHADPAATRDESLEELVVVANRYPVPISSIGNSITVLNEAAIKSSQATSMSDLLAQTPGINAVRNGGPGELATVFIRGADSDQTTVLIDGVQLTDAWSTTGGFFFSNLLTADIARIEILRGAQSTLYGSQAMGGVISITTTEPDSPFGGSLQAEGGSHDTGYGVATVGGKDGNMLWKLSGNWFGTSGIPAFDRTFGGTRASASQVGGGTGRLKYEFTPEIQLDLRTYYTQSRADTDGYDTPSGAFGDDGEYARNSQLVFYGGLSMDSPGHEFSNRVAYLYTNSATHEYDPAAPHSPFALNASTETFYGIGRDLREEYQGTWHAARRLNAVFGLQHERQTISTDTPAYDVTPAPLEDYVTIDSGYAQLQAEAAPGLNLTAGERYDRHNVFGGHDTGQLAAAWALNERSTVLRASFGQGFKAPSLYQLYSPYGNLGLRPEQADSWDAGLEQRALDDRLALSATYFRRDSRDLIDFFFCAGVTAPLCTPGLFGYYANVARAAAEGVELQAGFKATDQLDLAANYTHTDSENRSAGSANFGKQLARRPKDAANVSATYRFASKLTSTLAARYAGRSFDDAANAVALGGYVVVDLRASYAVTDRVEVYARVENATAKRYETVYQYGTLGRVGYAGFRAGF